MLQRKTKPNCFKVVLMGETSVGKSSIVFRFVKNDFSPIMSSTVGAAFLTKTIVIRKNDKEEEVRMELWDTAGQERFNSIVPMYYRQAQVAIVVYDITNPNSLTRAQHWIKELEERGPQDLLVVLVGNKIDLESKRKVDYEDGRIYAEKNGFMFREVSALNGTGISKLFDDIALFLLSADKKYLNGDHSSVDSEDDSFIDPYEFEAEENSTIYSKFCCF